MKHRSLTDTDEAADRVLIDLMRRAPAWRKLQLAAQLNQGLRQLALAGLRERHPGATEGALRRHLADQMLGPELARAAYGPPAAEGE